MKKIVYLIAITIALFSCKENERMVYTAGNLIYFSGIEEKMDSILFSLAGAENGSTYLVPVKVTGKIPTSTQRYKVVVVDDKTSAKEGIHYRKLEDTYILPADSVNTEIPLVLYNTDSILLKQYVRLRLKLVPTDEIGIVHPDRNEITVVFSRQLKAPTNSELIGFEKIFGPYSRVKHELIITLMGHDLYDQDQLPVKDEVSPIQSNKAYFLSYGRLLYNYILANEVIDENGKKLGTWNFN